VHKSREVRYTPVTALSLEHVLDEHLEAAQLKLVVAQVQHERLMAASDPKEALAIADQLDDGLSGPNPISAQGVLFQIGAVGAPHEVAPQMSLTAWQYVSESRDWVATVAPDFFSLETLSYGSWTEFRGRFAKLMAAVGDVLSPTLVRRAGLRYVDELKIPGAATAADWAGLIAPAFLGPAHDPSIGQSVTSIQQAVEFQGPGSARVTLRHGTVTTPDNKPGYLLDHDCYTDRGRRFEAKDLLEEYDGLHRLALGVFQRAITPEFYNQLKEGTRSI
jgi:uncharacterized protein (TIGR04255 family)